MMNKRLLMSVAASVLAVAVISRVPAAREIILG